MQNAQETYINRLKQADCRRLSLSEGVQEKNRAFELIAKAISLYSQQNRPAESPILADRDSLVNAPTGPSDDATVIALDKLGTASPRQIAQATGMSVPTVQRHLRALIKEGIVTKHGSTRSVRYQLSMSESE